MTVSDITWLAGILEGEGHFGVDTRREANYPTIGLNMADRDVVERAAQLMREIGDSPSQVTLKKARHDWKPQWRISLYGIAAELVMLAILPYMGERRSARICEVLELRKQARARRVKKPIKREKDLPEKLTEIHFASLTTSGRDGPERLVWAKELLRLYEPEALTESSRDLALIAA